MQDDDDFSNFNPKKHWAEHNNEIVSNRGPGRLDRIQIDRLAAFLKTEHTITEIIAGLKITRGSVIRLFGMMREIKGLSLGRREEKGILTYRVNDFRKKE